MNIQNHVNLGPQSYTASTQANESKASAITQAVNLQEISNTGGQLEDLFGSARSPIKDAFNVETHISLADAIECESNLQSLVAQMPVDINAMMALFQRLSQEMRNANREIRASELNAQVSDLLGAAKEMETAAKFRLAAGCVQGAMQIAAGGIQMAGAFKAGNDARATATATEKQVSPSQEISAAAPETTSTNPAPTANAAEASAPRTPYDVTMKKAEGTSEIIGGIGKVIGNSLNYKADLADAQAKRLEARARLHESASSEANEMMQQMLEVIRDVREKTGAIQQASIETNRGIARNV